MTIERPCAFIRDRMPDKQKEYQKPKKSIVVLVKIRYI